jgi:spore coat protein U-like protein
MNLSQKSLIALALAAAGAMAPVHAADNQDFQVLINIDASCDVVSTDDVDFATHAATPGQVTADGQVVVQCTKNTAYNVRLDGGLHSGNDINARKMQLASGTDTIAYQLYQSAGGPVWGQTDGADTVTGTGTGFGTGAPFDQAHGVHAVATLVGTEAAGAYADTVKATVTF